MKIIVVLIGSLLLLSLLGCTLSNTQSPILGNNLSPATMAAGSGSFSLTVRGNNFSNRCVVLWNATQRPTTVESTTLAVAAIPAADIASPGAVTVSMLDPVTGTKSNPVTFVITSGPPARSLTITLTPNATSLLTGGTIKFTATVSGSTNTAVNWSDSGGSVCCNGQYTAPNTPGTYTVTAASAADPTKSASATVTVTAPTTVAISISPSSASLTPAGTTQFTATVSGSSNTAVNWRTSGGTISSSGLYTAPSATGTYSVTATSAADATKSATATVTVAATVPHQAAINWAASTSSVVGYRVYRGTQSGGPYTLLNTILITTTSYVDNTVASGQTYYYVVSSVDSEGIESVFSSQVVAQIP